MFVTDLAIPASVNVATMLAGVHNGVVATPSMAGMFNLSMGAYPDSKKAGADLRTMHWRKDVEAYRWAFARIGAATRARIFMVSRWIAAPSVPSPPEVPVPTWTERPGGSVQGRRMPARRSARAGCRWS